MLECIANLFIVKTEKLGYWPEFDNLKWVNVKIKVDKVKCEPQLTKPVLNALSADNLKNVYMRVKYSCDE